MTDPKPVWRAHSVPVTLTFAVRVNAYDAAEARRYAATAAQMAEVAMGYANGEQPPLDGGITYDVQDALGELWDLLGDWPTMRALSALGAQKATARKDRARQIVMHLRQGVPLAPASLDHWQEG